MTNKADNELSTEQLFEVIGGQHCYNAACIQHNNHAMTGAGDFLIGFVKGFCQGLSLCK